MIINNIEDMIGNTPLFKLDDEIYLKLEMFNLGMSIKDRVAKNVILRAEETGLLGRNKRTILEYTSGNLGIGLSIISANRDYRVICVAESSISKEKLKLMRYLGTEVIVTDYNENTNSDGGMRGLAKKIHERMPNAYFIDQFENPWNPEAHYKTTAPEILIDLPTVSIIYCPIGTGGIITGIGRFFKENRPNVEIVGVTPPSGIIYTSFYSMNKEERPTTNTIIEGVGEDVIPKIMDFNVIDRMIEVDDSESISAANFLSKRGIIVGGSSGLTMAAAIKDKKSGNKVVICGDSGNRYLSTIYDSSWLREKINGLVLDNRRHYELEDTLKDLLHNNGKYPYLSE